MILATAVIATHAKTAYIHVLTLFKLAVTSSMLNRFYVKH